MKPGQSNAKGGKYERWVCCELTRWITGKPKPELFWRSATSGAKATQDAKKGHKSKMGGDIISVDAQGIWFTNCFSLECKDRDSYGNLDLLFQGRGDFLKWWEQAKADASRVNKVPMMICKRYRGDDLLVVPLWLETGSLKSGLSITSVPRVMTMQGADQYGLAIYLFEEWLATTKVSNIREIATEQKEQRDNSYLASRKPERPRHLGKAGQ
jgi:hypothetical protein